MLSAHTNGYAANTSRNVLLEDPVRKAEYVRLLLQSLRELGYKSSAQQLEQESGLLLESQFVTRFRSAVLEGQWQHIESLLPELKIEDPEELASVKFSIYRQKFLECLERGSVPDALSCLRHDLSPLPYIKQPKLHALASLLMFNNAKDIRLHAQWDGAEGQSRFRVLQQIQQHIPPSLMLPERRLQHLLCQAIEYQKSQCLFHNSNDVNISLLHDHCCTKEELPSQTTRVLEKHTDEVWYLQFSHSGSLLASASKDQTVIIWDMEHPNMEPLHVLSGHSQAVAFVSWSRDDTMLLSCGNDCIVKLWSTITGLCVRTVSQHTDCVTVCAWLPDNNSFVSGGVDKNIFLWHIDGTRLAQWHGARINDLAVSNDGKMMVAICSERKLRTYNLETREEESSIQESDPLTALCFSNNNKQVLVNVSSSTAELHLWDVAEARLVHKYRGHKSGHYVIKIAFGGPNESFVVSGSEDSLVYIWHRRQGTLLQALQGHSGTVNSVSWNPVHFGMLASASDDHTIRIWGLNEADEKLRQKRKGASGPRSRHIGNEIGNGVGNGSSSSSSNHTN
eukprot:GILK01004784.1.p1 GENE.GILK01004784.1~~GILK01004784.1.p1  ORF type:complete len:564 (+),score=107.43 GILK01004784.1:337-2028(+)